MHKNGTIFLLLTMLSFNTVQTAQLSNNYFSQKNVLLGVCGIATTLLVGKGLCSLYFDYFWPTKQMITYCKQSFATTHKIVQDFQKKYAVEAQLSDWDLKENICIKNVGSY